MSKDIHVFRLFIVTEGHVVTVLGSFRVLFRGNLLSGGLLLPRGCLRGLVLLPAGLQASKKLCGFFLGCRALQDPLGLPGATLSAKAIV